MTPTVTIQRAATVGILVTAAAGLTVALAAPPLPPVTDRIEVRPAFIASTARVLAPSVAAGAVEVRPSVIASTAAVRAPSVQPGAVTVQPAMIASTAQVRAPTVEALAPGAAEVRPAVIASTAAVPAPTVQPGAVSVAPALIVSTASVFAPAVQPGPVAVLPTVVGSTSAVFAPTIQAGASQIAPAIIASTAVVPSPVVQPGAVNVAPALIASTALVRAPTVAAAAAGYDPEAQAAFDAMTVQPAAARKQLYSDLVAGLKTDGVWSKLDWLTILAAHDAQAARLNLRAPTKSLAAVNTPSFTTDRGYAGDALSSHLSFNEAFNATGNQYALNSATIGTWCNLQGPKSGFRPLIGSSQSTRSYIRPNTAGNGEARMNDSTSLNLGAAEAMTGSRFLTRTGANARAYYRNGALSLSDTAVSNAIATGPAYLLRNGTEYADDRLAAAFTGGGITDAEAQAIHNRFSTFLTAIGAA